MRTGRVFTSQCCEFSHLKPIEQWWKWQGPLCYYFWPKIQSQETAAHHRFPLHSAIEQELYNLYALRCNRELKPCATTYSQKITNFNYFVPSHEKFLDGLGVQFF